MPTAFKPTDVPTQRAGLDISRLPLSAEEGFVLSRVDGHTTVKELMTATGLPERSVQDALEKLLRLQAISMGASAPAQGLAAEEDEEDLVELTPEERTEKVDLTQEQRLRLKTMDHLCAHKHHYAVLGVVRQASVMEVKRAYQQLSKEFHPDTYFRKNLGSFKPMLDRIFRHLKTAYDVLGDPRERARYDATVMFEEDAAALKRAAELRSWAMDPKRRKEMEERRLRRNPMMQRLTRAKRHQQRAQELYAQKQLAAAANEIALAVAQDPVDPTLRELQQKIQADIRAEKMTRLVAQAEAMLHAGTVDEEVVQSTVKQALELESQDFMVYVRLGRLLLQSKQLKAAREPADRALRMAPEDARTLTLMVDVYEGAGMTLNAIRMLEKLVQLHPNPERQERLKQLRRQL
ncbi:MAG: DnaJ domain-containing protein [Myxococcota bacterium]